MYLLCDLAWEILCVFYFWLAQAFVALCHVVMYLLLSTPQLLSQFCGAILRCLGSIFKLLCETAMRFVLPQNVNKANKDFNVSTTATRLQSRITEDLVRFPQRVEGCKG
jgi:hypothetical protein